MSAQRVTLLYGYETNETSLKTARILLCVTGDLALKLDSCYFFFIIIITITGGVSRNMISSNTGLVESA